MGKCRLAVKESRLLTTQRLFANKNVQYFGKEEDYNVNLTPGENNSFAGWTPNGSFFLKEMQVETDVQEGETLRIGIRTSNQYKNGSRETSLESGLFKVDNFRLELKELFTSGLKKNEIKLKNYSVENAKGGFFVRVADMAVSAKMQVYSVSGVEILSQGLVNNQTFVPLPSGVYFVRIVAKEGNTAAKVVVM
jgi:hypothetical protein